MRCLPPRPVTADRAEDPARALGGLVREHRPDRVALLRLGAELLRDISLNEPGAP